MARTVHKVRSITLGRRRGVIGRTTRFCEAKKTKMPNTDVRHLLKYYLICDRFRSLVQ